MEGRLPFFFFYTSRMRRILTTDGPVKAAISTEDAGNTVRYSFSLTSVPSKPSTTLT